MRFATSLILAAGAALAAPAAAHADGVKITQQLYTPAGDPMLVANHTPNGALATPSWSACTGGVCGPVLSTGNGLEPGPTPAGTSFQASTTVGGVLTTDSATWNGPLVNTAPPTFTGDATQLGSVLTPVAGSWSGGWGATDLSLLGLRACPTPAGVGCRAMTASSLQPGNPSTITLEGGYAGWYVGAVEARIGIGAAFTMIGYVTYPNQISGIPAPAPGPTVAVGPLVGPVPAPPKGPGSPRDDAPKADPPGEFSAGTPAATKVRIRKRVKRTRSRLVLGTLTCETVCTAKVTAKQGKRKRSWTIKSGPKGRSLTVAAKRFTGPGRIRVAVRMSGRATQTAWVRRR